MFSPVEPDARRVLEEAWRWQAIESLLAAKTSLRRGLFPTALARVEVRLLTAAPDGVTGIHLAGACRPSWHAVRAALRGVGVEAVRDTMRFGEPDPHGGQLVVELSPLVVGDD